MKTSTKRLLHGFTLVEILTVIAIIGSFAALIIPAIGKARETAHRSIDRSNIRQIGQSALIYSTDNRYQMPKWTVLAPGAYFGTATPIPMGETVNGFAAALAVGGGLNDANIWVSAGDATTTANNSIRSTVLRPDRQGFLTGFEFLGLAYGVVLGLNTYDAPTSPVAFTRGISDSSDARWSVYSGVYKDDGGHIVFLEGNVQFYRDFGNADVTGKLINSNGGKTWDIRRTVKISRKLVEETISGADRTAIFGAGH